MALLLSILVPSSPAMRRRKANGNKNTNRKTTVKVVITPTISTKETKKVKFQIPSDAFVALYSAAAVDHRRTIFRDGKQQQQVSDRRKQKNKQGEEKDHHQQSTDNHYYNPWYTSKELTSFRQDVWITSHWMVLNGIGSHSHRSKTTRRNNNTLGTVLFNQKKGLFNQRYNQANYVFCSRGMEGRTPIAKLFKIKRRKDAMQSVLAFQNQRCTAQAEQPIEMDNVDDNDDGEGDDENYVNALAKVYTSYCQGSRSIALYLGRENSIEAAGIIATESSLDERIKETQRPMMNNHNNKKYILLPANDDIVQHNNSLCDDSDSESDNNDYNHDSNGSSVRNSYSVALSVTTNPPKDSIPSPMKGRRRRRRRRRSTVPTPSSSSFCNDYHSNYYDYQHDYNHYRYDCDYDYDAEEESDVERELFGGGLISSICSSSSQSSSSSSSSISVSSSALSTKTIAVPPKSPAPSTSSSLVLGGRSSTTTTTSTPIGLLSELMADVVGTTAKTVPTTTDGPPSSLPSSSSSSSHPLSPTSFLLSKVSCLSSKI